MSSADSRLRGFVLPAGRGQMQDRQRLIMVAACRVVAGPRVLKKHAFRHQQQLFDAFWQRLKPRIGCGNRI